MINIALIEEAYKKLSNYQSLNDNDKLAFNVLLPVLLAFDNKLVISNKDLAIKLRDRITGTPMPLSTIEKRLRRLDRAGLINRITTKTQEDDGRYKTESRTLILDKFTYAQALKLVSDTPIKKEKRETVRVEVPSSSSEYGGIIRVCK